jgi:type VI secretion system VasI/ImpG family protein
MDPRLLRAYNEELAYLRESAREFGEEHDVVAGYLGLKTPNDPDPYVERLLEGVAFLGARVKLKLDDQFPEFTQHLLQAIQPHYLAPTPSMCVVAFEPQEGEASLAKGVSVPRLTSLTAQTPDHETPCVFRTGQAVQLLPIKLEEVEYLPSRAAIAPYAAAADVRADAGLRLRLRATGGVSLADVNAKELPLYIAGSEHIPGELYRQIVGDCVAAVARPAGAADGWTRLGKPHAYGFDDDCALLPSDGRSFRGYRLLSEYFACPERFLFASLQDIDRAFAGADEAVDIVLLFDRASPALTGAVTPANLRLFCSPAINLFEKQLGRVTVSPYEHEHLVLPDRTKPLDFEVFRLLEVTAHGAGGAKPAAPLYAFGALLYDWQDAIFHVTRLRARRLSTKEQRLRRRTDYTGTETWIGLSAPGDPDRLADVRELAIRALVTNRELPELLRFRGKTSDFAVDGLPVTAVTAVRAPTRPRPPLGLADAAWRVIGHLTPNYATLVSSDDGDPGLLRDHLALYGRIDDPAMRRQIDGVLAVRSETVTRRISGADRMAFARGRRVAIRLDDASFDNGRMFLFSAVISHFLAEFASVNSFVETRFESPNQGDFATWPARTGLRATI